MRMKPDFPNLNSGFSSDFKNVQTITPPQSDWLQEDETKLDYIKNKPNIEEIEERIDEVNELTKQVKIIAESAKEEATKEITKDRLSEEIVQEIEKAQDTADNASEKAVQAESIAKGKNQAKVFDTEAAMRATIDKWYCVHPGITLPAGSTIIMSSGGEIVGGNEYTT